tara:strand:+ start:491 stop:1018 length:528 start_codon:yes stop_codon:yes gene_type:complete
MEPAALGLTCKDAFQIFSQNETLRLQKRVAELEFKLAKYELPKRIFESHDQFDAARRKADKFLSDWIENNIHGCSWQEYDHEGWQYSVCNVWELDEAVSLYLQMMTLDVESSKYHADKLIYHVGTALDAARTASTETEWCRDDDLVRIIVHQALDDSISNHIIIPMIDWKLDDQE